MGMIPFENWKNSKKLQENQILCVLISWQAEDSKEGNKSWDEKHDDEKKAFIFFKKLC